MNRIGRRKAWPARRPRRIITIMIKRRNNLCPTEILRTIRPKIFLTRIYKEIRIIPRVKRLLIIIVITPRNLNTKNL